MYPKEAEGVVRGERLVAPSRCDRHCCCRPNGKVSASEVGDTGTNPCFPQSSHTSDFKVGILLIFTTPWVQKHPHFWFLPPALFMLLAEIVTFY